MNKVQRPRAWYRIEAGPNLRLGYFVDVLSAHPVYWAMERTRSANGCFSKRRRRVPIVVNRVHLAQSFVVQFLGDRRVLRAAEQRGDLIVKEF